MNFIDIHGHYAWDVDDGMPTIEETKKALSKASKQGISEIIATPHMCCGQNDLNDKTHIIKRIDELKLLSYRYNIKIHLGCELMLNSHIKDTIQNDLFIPLASSRYILCEDNVRKANNDFLEFFDIHAKELIYQGYIPVIAHVERYFHGDIDLDYVRYLIELGCIIQVNTTSILGQGHPQHHLNAMKLLDNQLVHIIASDSHRAEGMRIPNMLECYEYLLKKGYLDLYMNLLMYENPKRIIQNRNILNPHFKKPQSFFKKIFTHHL